MISEVWQSEIYDDKQTSDALQFRSENHHQRASDMFKREIREKYL